jgi:hypothetical protein
MLSVKVVSRQNHQITHRPLMFPDNCQRRLRQRKRSRVICNLRTCDAPLSRSVGEGLGVRARRPPIREKKTLCRPRFTPPTHSIVAAPPLVVV